MVDEQCQVDSELHAGTRVSQIRRVALIAGLMAFGITLGACGSDGGGSVSGGEDTSAANGQTSLAELVDREPYPIRGALPDEEVCGTMEYGDDNLDPESDQGLIDLGAINSSSTFCGDSELGIQSLYAVEFSDPTTAADVVEDEKLFGGVAGSEMEAHGDIRCQSFIDDGDQVPVCAMALSNIVLVVTGEAGVDSETVIENGIVPMATWAEGE